MTMPRSVDASSATGERHYDELAALYRIAALSASRADRSMLIDEILPIVQRLVGAERVLLFTCDERTDQLQLHDQQGQGAVPFPTSNPGVIARVLKGHSGELVNDLTDDEEGDQELSRRTRARQVVAAPMLLGESSLGVLAAVNCERGAFTDEDLRILSLLGDRIALTLENTNLVGTLERQIHELQGLQRLSRLLGSGDDLDHVIGESIRVVFDLIDCEKLAILLYDDETDHLVGQEPAIGITDEELAALRVPLREPSLGGTVYRTNTPLSSNEAHNDAWVNRRFAELLEIRSLLAVPLATGPRPVGILKAVNSRKGYFDEDEINYAALLGRQIAAILETNLARNRERELVRELKEADRTKSEFVSMLAHELKGPMTTVLGFSHTLREQWRGLEDAKRDQVLEIIHKEVGRLSRLVNDLLDVSRMEAGTIRYDLEPTSLQDTVESLLVVHSSFRSEHAVIANLPEDLPKVLADKDRIRQVIINLLTNATRYSPGQTTITVGAEVVEEEGRRFVRLSVADEGIGIAEQDAARIFTKFAMLPKPGWTKKGTGLGLYITKGIVEAMGGRIWVQSDVGRGSTFYVTLQVAHDASSA